MNNHSKKPPKVEQILLMLIIMTLTTSAIFKYFNLNENVVNFLIFYILFPLVIAEIYLRMRNVKLRK